MASPEHDTMCGMPSVISDDLMFIYIYTRSKIKQWLILALARHHVGFHILFLPVAPPGAPDPIADDTTVVDKIKRRERDGPVVSPYGRRTILRRRPSRPRGGR
jgi:hypothetical protein